ncbi:MAG: Smr/MutS family protein [Burkholderiaceae bacterium]|jgi:DNA-nicking Smr family endonuclease
MGRPPARGSLAELAALRDTLREQERAKAEAQARARAEQARLDRERLVFREAVADAAPLRPTGRVDPAPAPVPPVARQFELDERRALTESISDEIDIERLLDTDEELSYRRPGVGPDVPRRLRRGDWVLQKQIDLHGLRVDEAREALLTFIADCVKRELRCLRVVHGKGLGSVNKEPVLKGKVLRWLAQRDEVLAFCQAGPNDGGSGALIVLLRPPASTARPRRRR